MDVRAEHGPRRHRRQRPLGDQLRAGRIGLLAGLEDPHERDGEPLAELRGGAEERDQGREVHVVPAGVHRLAARAERRAGALRDRQAVELGAHGEGTSLATHPGEQPGAGDRLGRDWQLGRDGRPGAVLGVRQLGVGVQAVAQLDRRTDPGLQRLQQLVEHGR